MSELNNKVCATHYTALTSIKNLRKVLQPIVFISVRRQFLHRNPSGAYKEPLHFDPSDEEIPEKLFMDEYEEDGAHVAQVQQLAPLADKRHNVRSTFIIYSVLFILDYRRTILTIRQMNQTMNQRKAQSSPCKSKKILRCLA